MYGLKVILSLYLFLLVVSTLLVQTLALKAHYYKLEEDEGVLDLTKFKKLTVNSELNCVSRCELDDKCFLATYRKSSTDCYLQTDGCAVQETIEAVGWIVFHKTDSCFQACKAPRFEWFQYFCTGTSGICAYCYENEDLFMLTSVYGNVGCPTGIKHVKLMLFPLCGKYVTDQMAALCNGRNNCTCNANSAMFGTTNCGGDEDLYVEYICRKYCLNP